MSSGTSSCDSYGPISFVSKFPDTSQKSLETNRNQTRQNKQTRQTDRRADQTDETDRQTKQTRQTDTQTN